MRIAVVGAGAAGIFTAWELALDGHEVTVYERKTTAAEEASFGHAGLMAPACAALGLGQSVAPASASAAHRSTWRPWRSKKSRDEAPASLNDDPRMALALWSQTLLANFVKAFEIDWQHSDGVTVLLRHRKDGERLQSGCAALREAAIAVEQLDAEAAGQLEPGLDRDQPLAGALRLPLDFAGNCRQLVLYVRLAAERRSVVFRFGETVTSVTGGARPELASQTSGQAPTSDRFDAVVLCCGTGAEALLESCGQRPVFSRLQSYSVSAPIREMSFAPLATVIDSAHSAVVVTRFGDRLRVAGAGHRGPASDAARSEALRSLYRVLQECFPGAARLSSGVQEWHGERLALPDDLPLLGPSGAPGVWLNLAHGANGWALVPGAARLLANALSEPVLPEALESFGIGRLARTKSRG